MYYGQSSNVDLYMQPDYSLHVYISLVFWLSKPANLCLLCMRMGREKNSNANTLLV